MALNETALRAAGLPASLISLLVSITKAADRATFAANSAAAANDLAPQLAAAVQAIETLGLAPGMGEAIADLAARLRAVENATDFIPEPILKRLVAVEAAIAGMQDKYDDTSLRDLIAALTERVNALEEAAAASPVMVTPPSLLPASVTAGDKVDVSLGTFTGASPVGVLRFLASGQTGQGVDVTASIINGKYTTTAAGTLTLTVTAAPLSAVSVSATVAAAPVQTIAADSVVVIGASLMYWMFGRNTATPHGIATPLLEQAGFNLPVYGYATQGSAMADALSHYTAARTAHPNAMIIMHFGGNDVTANRPYPGGIDIMQQGLDALLTAAEGDPLFYPASITFRYYDQKTFNDPGLGSKPYNENLIIPWIAEKFPHAMASYGRPKFDFYRIMLQNYDTWLSTDRIHPTADGYTAFRAWIVARMAEVLGGVQPAQLTERVYTPPAGTAPKASTPPTISPSTGPVGTKFTITRGTYTGSAPITVSGVLKLGGVDVTSQMVGSEYTSTAEGALTWEEMASNGATPNASQVAGATVGTMASTGKIAIINFSLYDTPVGYNHLVASPSHPMDTSLANIRDIDGANTGMSLNITFSPGTNLNSSTDPGADANGTGRNGGAPVYSGQLYASNILSTSYYVTATPTGFFTISGATPGASYEVGMVGTRAATNRHTRLTVQGVATTWDAGEDPPVERKVTVQADANGQIAMELKAVNGSTFAYLSGLSIQKLQ